jgi:hypothetical protein
MPVPWSAHIDLNGAIALGDNAELSGTVGYSFHRLDSVCQEVENEMLNLADWQLALDAGMDGYSGPRN